MSEYREKLLSIGVISKRSRPQVTEGREHPETGRPWKTVEDESGTVTEHAVPGDRVDAVVKAETVRMPEAVAAQLERDSR